MSATDVLVLVAILGSIAVISAAIDRAGGPTRRWAQGLPGAASFALLFLTYWAMHGISLQRRELGIFGLAGAMAAFGVGMLLSRSTRRRPRAGAQS